MSSYSSDALISIVVPYLNPNDYFVDHIRAILKVMEEIGNPYEVIAVNDGSTDGSDIRLKALNHPNIKMLENETNFGKGYSIRRGFRRCSGELIAFIDADGDIPASVLKQFVTYALNHDFDVLLGSKYHPDSVVNSSVSRKLSSRTYQTLVKLLFKLDLSDTQTGIKLLKREIVEQVLDDLKENGFAFDLELLITIKRHGFSNFVELPVTIIKRQSSTLDLKNALGLVGKTFSLYKRHRFYL